ncbi:MAG: hypothetical protein COA77_01795 [Thaumarchaeota archaeon]|nr:MAG: hypothetical protein COA77_01795 [Nitrososphaerota archaeon]
MVKDRKEEAPKKKKSDFKAFLKKRAPIYLALIAMFVVFGIPEFTKGSLEKSFPEFTAEEQQIVDILMKYDGGNGGYTLMNAISDKIAEEYPDEKIYDHKKTVVELSVSNINLEENQVVLYFKSHQGEMNFDWNVNSKSSDITSNNPESKHLIDKVKFYD